MSGTMQQSRKSPTHKMATHTTNTRLPEGWSVSWTWLPSLGRATQTENLLKYRKKRMQRLLFCCTYDRILTHVMTISFCTVFIFIDIADKS